MALNVCPYITSANIALRGGGFALYSLKWAENPIGKQLVLVQYRKYGDLVWINVSTNLQVDEFGNLMTATSLVILAVPLANTVYEVKLANQCGSIEYIQQFTFPKQIYTNLCLIDNYLYNICGTNPVPLFSSAPFDVGVVMYSDVGLSTPQTGYLYIDYNGSTIFGFNAATGAVQAATGYTCTPYSFLVLLSNATATVCAAVPTTVYSNVFEPTTGDILYSSPALYTPLTGYTFLAFQDSKVKYNLNTGTGQIGGEVGTSCSGYFAYYRVSKVKQDIDTVMPALLYSSTVFGKGAEMKTDSGLTTAVTGYNYIKQSNANAIYDISTTTGIVGCIAGDC